VVISHSKKFIFIHVPKTAGSSIKTALNPLVHWSWRLSSKPDKLKFVLGIYPSVYSYDFSGHERASDLMKKLPSHIFNKYFKFCFVRNPYSWLVSIYHYILKDEQHHQHELVKKLGSFDSAVRFFCDNQREQMPLQLSYISDDDGNPLVDYIGHLETLSDDWAYLNKRLNLNIHELPIVNKTNHEPAIKYYSTDTIARVSDAFHLDFLKLNYSKEISNQMPLASRKT